MAYTLHLQSGSVVRDSDGKEVAPCQSVDEPDFIEYQEWVEEGNTPYTIDETPIVLCPQSLTRRQFKLALIRSGLYEIVEAMIAATTDLELKVTYQEAQDFERHNPMTLLMADLLGKTDSEIDALFILGDSL